MGGNSTKNTAGGAGRHDKGSPARKKGKARSYTVTTGGPKTNQQKEEKNASVKYTSSEGTTPQTLDLQTAVTPVVDSTAGIPDAVTAVVCNVDDLKDGEMREVEVGDGKALLVRENGEFHAIGAKCTHFGAPLAKGALCKGRVRCPWHGACFNIRTGDIEDFPGLDSVQKFNVEVSNGKVKVHTSQTALNTKKRVRTVGVGLTDDERTFLIIGGGPASVACAETLRQEGFKGKVIILTKEEHLPYDRTMLSKSLSKKADDLALRNAEFYSGYDIELKRNSEVTSVDPAGKSVTLVDGQSLKYDKLLVATGGSARPLTVPGSDLQNVFVLRTPNDANRIAAESHDKDVVIVGTSFIGMELAAYCVKDNKSVTVLGRSSVPFKQSLGDTAGSVWQKLHEAKGVKFITNNSPKELIGEGGRLKEVVLEDDTRLPADVLIAGIGVYPTTDFLKDSGIDMSSRGYVKINKNMETSKEDVYAAGDIVDFPLFTVDDDSVNVQHWQMAHAHGRNAALNMLGRASEVKSVPFFWTTMFGKSLRYTGFGHGYDDVVIHGDPDELKFLAYYTKGDAVVAVASMGWDPICAQAANMFYNGNTITKDEVKESPDAWVSRLH